MVQSQCTLKIITNKLEDIILTELLDNTINYNRRKPNKEIRPREFLYEHEIESMMKACRQMRNGLRNETMILINFRRGMRPSETVRLKWEHICFQNNTMRVVRLKNGISGDHVIRGREVLLLKRLYKEKIKNGCNSPYVFVTHFGLPMTLQGYQWICWKLSKMVGFPFKAHPHMFRHSWAEYARIKKIDVLDMKAHMGHANITNTLKYLQNTGNSDFPGLFAD